MDYLAKQLGCQYYLDCWNAEYRIDSITMCSEYEVYWEYDLPIYRNRSVLGE